MIWPNICFRNVYYDNLGEKKWELQQELCRVISLCLGSPGTNIFLTSSGKAELFLWVNFNQVSISSPQMSQIQVIGIVFPWFSSFNMVLYVLLKNTTASQSGMSFSDESSDSLVLVYKLLTALGFIGMKDALFIVLWDERCIIYNTRITILFTLVTLKSHSFLVMELQKNLV